MSMSAASAGEFEKVDSILRRSVIKCGNKLYDEKTHLVHRVDDGYDGRLIVAQQTPEYAAALLDAGRDIDRANAIIGALLDHQWTKDKGTMRYGNFIWWHDQKRPEDMNAVAFMTPWLCRYLIDHPGQLTDENKRRLGDALPLCLIAVRSHIGPVHYDNPWFLKAASLAMLARALDRPALLKDAETRLGQWIAYVSKHGVSEYNSPCYAAVSIYALEFIWHYAPKSAKTLRAKTQQLLDFLYADAFQNWHWEGSIGAGTHSRGYPNDRVNGKSLVSFLVYKQCGGKLRGDVRTFEYNFAANDYRVPDRIRSYAEKKGKTPMWLRASHPVYKSRERVERCLYMLPEVTLGTQTGYRVAGDQAVPFKITYAGSKVDERASLVRPIPAYGNNRTQCPVRFGAHQDGPRAIVLYEADMKGQKNSAYLRLVIEPGEGGMLDEILVNGKPTARNRRELKPGAVIAWRVKDALVAIRLLDSRGVNAAAPARLVPRPYVLSPIKDVGLCLHGLVCYRPRKPVAIDDLSCGFVVRVGTVKEFGSLAKLSEAAASWTVAESRDGATRDIAWADGDTSLRLVWNGARDAVAARCTGDKKLGAFPLYESPLIDLQPGGSPAGTPTAH